MKIIRKTTSLCPECLKKIPADIVEQANKVFLIKRCENHGEFKDVYFGHADLYHKYLNYLQDKSAQSAEEDKCPDDCGVCERHQCSPVLANIDLTSACNFDCPLCFAHSKDDPELIQPTIDEISRMMDALRNCDPPCEAVQFSGGEPTLREDFFEIAKLARKKGFIQLQAATNGKILAENPEFAGKLANADFDTVYLQFDGVTPEPYIALRGFNALPIKLKAIENVRESGSRPNIVLVPTIARGINDHQVGDIIRFAADNIDVVRGINFQPIAYTGRVRNEDLLNRRITISDLLHNLDEQMNDEIGVDDFLPVTIANVLMEFLQRVNPQVKYPLLTTHPLCGVWTFAFKDRKKLIPLTRIIHVEELFKFLGNYKEGSNIRLGMNILRQLHRFIKPKSIRLAHKIVRQISNLLTKQTIEAASAFSNSSDILFIGADHFMDPYNFDFDRLRRCCIHYATPDGKVVPFCSYNMFYRKEINRTITTNNRKE